MNVGQAGVINMVSEVEFDNKSVFEKVELIGQGVVILCDKSSGITSHDLVFQIRKKITQHTGLKPKVGHAGTLDPLATGVMLILVGPAVKQQAWFTDLDKEYDCEALMGLKSDTLDVDGVIEYVGYIDRNQLLDNKSKFVGYIRQQVPVYSALKQKGKKLYQLAREGNVDWKRIPLRDVRIKTFEILDWTEVESVWLKQKFGIEGIGVWLVKIRFEVGSGTYIRSIIHEWGQSVGSDGVVYKLRRTKVGEYEISNI